MSAKSALYKYLDKHARENQDKKPRRKNKTPEADLQKEIIINARKDGFEFYITDSSAKWNEEAQAYISDKFAEGMSDLTGDRDGIACYVEVKAPGKRSTLKEHQREFLIEKINRGCFAMCADSYEDIVITWNKWRQKGNYKQYLIDCLPKSKIIDDGKPLFD
jgi:hypothetical protein